jgi:C-terminal processing protease CtpA/Prc
LLQTRYVDAEKGRTLASRLLQDAGAGRWDASADPASFAKSMTAYLREISGDGHLGLDYASRPLPESTDSTYAAENLERWYGAGINHGFEEIRRLDGHIGYLNLRVFAPVSMAGDVASAAMTLLAQSDALIVDLRANGGGYGNMVELLAGYLFDQQQELSGTYNRPSGIRTHSTTPSWVPGRRFGGKKPLYILISQKTFSAAEQFAYDLQAARRAVIVGETSGGGAHPFEYRRVGQHFMLWLPESRSVNPITGKDWQGSGVQPDVAVAADQALEQALKLARTELTTRTKDSGGGQQRR